MKKLASLILALALCLGLCTPVFAAGFSDVPAGHYAASAIDSCVAKGIASGYSDGTFKPNNPVTRAQFCVMLVRAFYAEDLKLWDTEENRALGWFVPYTETLDLQGMNSGILENASFENQHKNASVMDQPISRYDMAALMGNILSYNGRNIYGEDWSSVAGKIGDWSRIQYPYSDLVGACYSLGILSGQSDGTFGGDKTMNRAQACVVIDRLAKVLAGESLASSTGTQTTSTTVQTLTNGKPATEENVYAMLMQFKELHPYHGVLFTSYAEGDNSPVKKVTSNYLTFDSKTVSVTRGYGAVSAFFSDKIFGTNVTYRKVDLSEVKPGDIALFPCDEGKIQVSLTVLGRLTTETAKQITFYDPDQIGGTFCVFGAELNGQTIISSWDYPYGPVPNIDYWSCY